MKQKIFWIVILLLVVGAGVYFMMGEDLNNPTDDQPVDVQNDFETKVVYTTDMSVDTAPLEADCELRGGEFNECGSVCEPGAEICTEQCAYTCDDINPDEGIIGDDVEDSDSTSTATSSEEGTTGSATSTN